jgi:hypothetical protein
MPVVLLDTHWNNSTANGDYWYRPLPSNVDVLAMDRYTPTHPETCTATTFENEVGFFYRQLAALYGKPILMYAQAVHATTLMPAPDCFNRFYDLAQDVPSYWDSLASVPNSCEHRGCGQYCTVT